MIKVWFLSMFSCAVLLLGSCRHQATTDYELWYDKPAGLWEEALPIGNGRLGAMVYGIPQEEHIQFNEETLWDSGPRNYNRPGAWKHLEAIRQLLFDGKQKEAESLAMEVFMGRKTYEDEFVAIRTLYADSILQLPLVQEAIRLGFDDSEWPVMTIDYKSVWENHGLPDLNGSVLFRRKVTVPASWANETVQFEMGRLKDEDYTYVNGQLVGSTYEENGNRVYQIPAGTFQPGENELVVLINNYVSTGGFNGVRQPPHKMNLQNRGASRDTVMTEGDWKYHLVDDKAPYYPQYQANYQPFGDLKLSFPGHENFKNFRRSLDLTRALAHVSYEVEGVRYEREYLSSYPDDVMAMRFSADQSGSLTFSVGYETAHLISSVEVIDDQTLVLNLEIENGDMEGSAWMHVTQKGGEISAEGGKLHISQADEAVIKLVARTNYQAWNSLGGDPFELASMAYERVRNLDYKQIRKRHLADYRLSYGRFDIYLGDTEQRQLPTDARIRNIEKGPDNDLAAMYVQFARYLMLSSGRSGTLPPNLQGIWNDKLFPAWGSKHTLNINFEMNFWPVEPMNMAESHESMFRMIEEVAEAGAQTAHAYYNAPGWVVHHNTDQWRGTAPINNSNHGIWVAGGAWLCQHLWEHYLYNQDLEFLSERAYPLMRGAAEFYSHFLVRDPQTGYLISTPSNSPEHGGLVAGPAMDHQLIRALYRNVIESSKLLDADHEFADLLAKQLSQLPPDQIGRHGQLQEWMEDVDDPENKHRHVSHLWGVHPGNEINWEDTPELMDAARQSLVLRGDDGTGWSLGWKINFWARFLDGEYAHHMIQMLLSDALDEARNGGGGSYPNLLDAHPPFQIDGNFGGAAGIAEMLVQSHLEYIDLLPALPSAWSDGFIKGMRVRGNFELDMEWKDRLPVKVRVVSHSGKPLKLRFGNVTHVFDTEVGGVYEVDNWN
jgi:alpha-L-fucosidase 2